MGPQLPTGSHGALSATPPFCPTGTYGVPQGAFSHLAGLEALYRASLNRLGTRLPGPGETQEQLQTSCRSFQEVSRCMVSGA